MDFQEYGYFDSEITGYDEEGFPILDRAQNSEIFALFYSKLISNGVLATPADCLMVQADEGMTIKVNPGFIIINGHFGYNVKSAEITLDDAPSQYRRITVIIARLNLVDRKIEIVFRNGDTAVNPTPPELIRPTSGDYYELCLATILVNSNQTVIVQSNITDTRYDSSVCGVVTQLIDHLDTSVFYAQLNAFYEEFVARSNITYEEFKRQTIDLYNTYIEDITEYTDKLKSDADDIYNIYLADLRALYKKFKENAQKEYDGFHTEIIEYIEELKDRGDTNLATITQQLLDFRNTNETDFLTWWKKLKGLSGDGQLLIKIEELESQIEDMMEMLMTGTVYTKLLTADGNYIVNDKGKPILVGRPICQCKYN